MPTYKYLLTTLALVPSRCLDHHHPRTSSGDPSKSWEKRKEQLTFLTSHVLCSLQVMSISRYPIVQSVEPLNRHGYSVQQIKKKNNPKLQSVLHNRFERREKENFLVFEFNYISRCGRGQGLKIKVQGCGVPRLGTGLQCVHSSLEGGDEHGALCFFFPPLPVSGLILRR